MKKVTLVTTMNMLMAIQRAKLALVLLPAVSITLLCASPAKAGTTITQSTCPVLISQPGEYTLGTDVGPCAPGVDGIIIAASNVTLNLKGHTISGSASSGTCNSSNGIHVMGTSSLTPLTLVRVLGKGTITNFTIGFLAENSAGSFVKFVTVTQTPPTPCADFTFGFFIMSPSSQWKLEGNVVRKPGDNSFGIVLGIGANDCDLVRNNVNDTISVQSNNNNIINNIANDNFNGIFVAGSNNEIHANTTNNNSAHGLWLGCNFSGNCPSGNNISGNTSLGNSVFDMEDDTPNCDNNKWRGNKFRTANQSCIH